MKFILNDKVNVTFGDLLGLSFSEESVDRIYGKSLQNDCNPKEKIYLLIEQLMNGTVTMNIYPSGIKAESFADAVLKLKEKIEKIENIRQNKVDIKSDNDNEFSYTINDELIMYGRIENKELKMM
jgi:hypothetical protein